VACNSWWRGGAVLLGRLAGLRVALTSVKGLGRGGAQEVAQLGGGWQLGGWHLRGGLSMVGGGG
jgi:hypothetical protein